MSDSYSDFSVELKSSCFVSLAVTICELGCEFAICVSFSQPSIPRPWQIGDTHLSGAQPPEAFVRAFKNAAAA